MPPNTGGVAAGSRFLVHVSTLGSEGLRVSDNNE